MNKALHMKRWITVDAFYADHFLQRDARKEQLSEAETCDLTGSFPKEFTDR